MEWLWLTLASLLGVIWVFVKGRSEGRKQERGKQSSQLLEAAREARKIEDDSRTLSDADVVERMRERNKRR